MGSSPETRELAYTIWREHGQNVVETVRVMNSEHGYVISRQSVTTWAAKYGWHDRAARAEAEEKNKAEKASDDSLLSALLNQKKKYEDYFDALSVGEVDNPAIYAYSKILKTLLDIRERISGDKAVNIDRPKVFLEDMEFIVSALKELDPEGLKTFGRNFDVIVARFKGQHEKAA